MNKEHDIGGNWKARYDGDILVIYKDKEAFYLSKKSQDKLKEILK